MRRRHHRGQSPARQYFYLHRAILRRTLEFIPTPPTPHQLDQFRRLYYTHVIIYTKIYTLREDHFTYPKTVTNGSTSGRTKQDERRKRVQETEMKRAK